MNTPTDEEKEEKGTDLLQLMGYNTKRQKCPVCNTVIIWDSPNEAGDLVTGRCECKPNDPS